MVSKVSAYLLAGTVAVSSILTGSLPAHAFDDTQKKEMGEIIRQYLIENPEVLLEAQQAYQAKQELAAAESAKAAISENKKVIFNDEADLVLGNPKGDVTVVEFYDYNCGYCKQAINDMNALLKADSNVRFVLKEFPILGQDSVDAHQVALAFRALNPEKYSDFHMKLLGGQARATKENALKVAEALGVSADAIEKEMAKDDGTESINATYQLADALGIRGTPAYIVGDELIPGATGVASLAEKVANMRSCGKAEC